MFSIFKSYNVKGKETSFLFFIFFILSINSFTFLTNIFNTFHIKIKFLKCWRSTFLCCNVCFENYLNTCNKEVHGKLQEARFGNYARREFEFLSYLQLRCRYACVNMHRRVDKYRLRHKSLSHPEKPSLSGKVYFS